MRFCVTTDVYCWFTEIPGWICAWRRELGSGSLFDSTFTFTLKDCFIKPNSLQSWNRFQTGLVNECSKQCLVRKTALRWRKGKICRVKKLVWRSFHFQAISREGFQMIFSIQSVLVSNWVMKIKKTQWYNKVIISVKSSLAKA